MFSKNLKLNEGFTLAELIVVMAIATVIITSVVVQQSRWNDRLAVDTQAYELALMIRQAQIYSLGVREYTAGTDDKFNIGYGVHFDTSGPPSERYIFFADRDGDFKYDPEEEIETKYLTKGVKVNKICSAVASPCPGSSGLKQIDVSFLRPLSNAHMIFMDNTGAVISPQPPPPAFLKVKSADGLEVVIKVETNGQISVQ